MSSLHLQLRDDISLDYEGDDLVISHKGGLNYKLHKANSEKKVLLNELKKNGGNISQLMAAVQREIADVSGASIIMQLLRLEQTGLLTLSARSDQKDLLILQAFGSGMYRKHLPKEAEGMQLRLSRFATLEPVNGLIQISVPMGCSRLVLMDNQIAPIITTMATPSSPEQLRSLLPVALKDKLDDVITLLLTSEVVDVCNSVGEIASEQKPAIKMWSYNDWHFHNNSRENKDNFSGSKIGFPWAGILPHPPAIKPVTESLIIELPKPKSQDYDPGFYQVLESRRSIRDYADSAISLDQLGRLLWYVNRIKQLIPANQNDPNSYEASLRPVPSGGGMHEIELYLTITNCIGIEPGLYRYDPLGHLLCKVSEMNDHCKLMLKYSRQAGMLKRSPDILITMAARHGRVAWKYEGFAYALILKHVGVLYQQLYLVATALDLAPCAIGNGNAEAFAKATGLDPFHECSVGEFILGLPNKPIHDATTA